MSSFCLWLQVVTSVATLRSMSSPDSECSQNLTQLNPRVMKCCVIYYYHFLTKPQHQTHVEYSLVPQNQVDRLSDNGLCQGPVFAPHIVRC